jgi:uncharacterized protein YuzE
MSRPFLEVTFREGKPIAAYYYLPRQKGDVAARTDRRDDGILIDFTADGRAIGIELTTPSRISLERLNQVLTEINQTLATPADLQPLTAA